MEWEGNRSTLEVGGFWQINRTISDLMNHRKHHEVGEGEERTSPKLSLKYYTVRPSL
jgi:hypothetical protein